MSKSHTVVGAALLVGVVGVVYAISRVSTPINADLLPPMPTSSQGSSLPSSYTSSQWSESPSSQSSSLSSSYAGTTGTIGTSGTTGQVQTPPPPPTIVPPPPQVDLVVQADQIDPQPKAGTNVVDTLIFFNDGPDKATSKASLTVSIPSPLTFVSADNFRPSDCVTKGGNVVCSIDPLGVNSRAGSHFTFAIPSTFCGKFQIMESITGPDADPNPTNNSLLLPVQTVMCPPPPVPNLYVTGVPTGIHQLLGSTLSDPIFSLNFASDTAPVQVTRIAFDTINSSTATSDVDRLELYKADEKSPFAVATSSACVAENHAFCVDMANSELVVANQTTIFVRARMKTDVNGAVSAHKLTLALLSQQPSKPNIQARLASGQYTSLLQNNNNGKGDGEVFIGTKVPTPNVPVVGTENVVVLAKIGSIRNANPDADGTAVPTGVNSPIGAFSFSALPNLNAKNGLNKAVLSDIIFIVTSSNVEFSTTGFKLMNKADPTAQASCIPYRSAGQKISSATVTDQFFVWCTNLTKSTVNTSVDQGTSVTLSLLATINKSKINGTKTSSLTVSLTNFGTSSAPLSFGNSHIQWLDKDDGGQSTFTWIDSPDTVITSTTYRS